MKHLLLATTLIFISLITVAQNEAGYIWGNVKMGGGGFVTGIITTPAEKNLIYARTDVGGAYRWDETSQGWIPLLDWNSIDQTSYQGVESLAIDPSAPNRLYMLVGTSYWNGGISAILRSEDYGNTFQVVDVTSRFKVHGNGMGRQTGEKLAVDPNKGDIIFCGTRLNGLFKSEDAGMTWNKVSSFPVTPTGSITDINGIASVLFDPASAETGEATQRIFVSLSVTGSDNLFVTEDGGATWTAIEGAVADLMPHRMIIAHGSLYLTYVNNTGPWNIGQTAGAVYKYDLSESTWSNITPAANIPYAGITVDHQNPDHLLVSTINVYNAQNMITGVTAWGDRIYRSTNGGETWVQLFSMNKITLDPTHVWDTGMSMHWVGDIKVDPFNSDRVFAISGNGIFMTKNLSAADTGKSTWHLQVDKLEETVPMSIVSIPNGPAISVIYDYDGFVHNSVYLSHLRHRPSVGNTTGLDFAQNNTQFVVRSGADDNSPSTIFYSLNQGTTWTAFATKPDPKAHRGQVAVSANGDKVIWRPDGVNNTFFTRDRGATWKPVSDQAITGRPVSDRVNNNIFYVFSSASLRIFTYNEGQDKYDVQIVSIGFAGRDIIRTVPHMEGEVWIANNDNGLRRYRKADNSVTKIASVGACRAVGFGKAPSGKTFPAVFIWGKVEGVEGIFRSDDEGESWLRINDDNHQFGGPGNAHFINGDANVFGRVYMSTVGRGIVMGYPEGETSVYEPVNFIRDNSRRDISFSNSFTLTTESARATYYIYNMAGALLDSGSFSGSKELGVQLSNGMYILFVRSDRGNETRKILKHD